MPFSSVKAILQLKWMHFILDSIHTSFLKNVYLFVEIHSNKDTLSQASIGPKGIRFCVKFKVFFPKSVFPDKRLHCIKRELQITGKT